MTESSDLGNSENYLDHNPGTNGSKNAGLTDYAQASNSTETTNKARSNEASNNFTGTWEAPRAKRRGRKPGSGLAARLARKEAGAGHTDNGNNQPEVRRRKRDTEVLVGEQIRRLRLESGLSQEELGRASSMSTSYISRLETNEVNPTVDALNRIVRVFGLTIDGLLGLDTNAPTILNSEELDPEIRVWLFKLKGKKVSERTKKIIQVVINEELEELRKNAG